MRNSKLMEGERKGLGEEREGKAWTGMEGKGLDRDGGERHGREGIGMALITFK